MLYYIYTFFISFKYIGTIYMCMNPFRKFICLNDDIDPIRRSENEIVRALLNDFYRSLYPLQSTFELPSQYRNRFSHLHELLKWQASRAKARNLLLCLLALLLMLTFYHVLYHHMRRLCRTRELSTFLVWRINNKVKLSIRRELHDGTGMILTIV